MALSDIVRTLLTKRGITTESEIAAFLAPDYVGHTHDAMRLWRMDRATARIFEAIERGETIAIYADFDCDGIPGAAVLHDFFKRIGYGQVIVYLPHRDREGYGFHTAAIQKLADDGVSLIITVDVGTNATDAVRFAHERGIDVIVTDHHEITSELPNAVAILNPKIAPYPFPSLCGAAVAFKLVQALLAEGKRRGIERFANIQDGWEKWLLDLVAIATVADMVPLVGENRALVHFGLRVLRKSPRPGIRALCSALRLRQSDLTEDDIGFSIAPRINAASRMDEPDLAFRLLTTTDAREAEKLAAQLEALNASRKAKVGGIVREVRKRVKDRYKTEDKVVVLGNPEWKPALLGLAANSIVGDRGGVACLWGRDAEGRIKGSCRSDGALSVVELFRAASHAFEEYGGHEASGGFTLHFEHAHTLPDVLADVARTIEASEVSRALEHDALISLREVDVPLFRDISVLAPFGIGNPKPVFRIARAEIARMRRFGKEKNHIELSLMCRESGVEARAFDFFRGPDDFTSTPIPESAASILATIDRDTFRGGLALRIVDILPV